MLMCKHTGVIVLHLPYNRYVGIIQRNSWFMSDQCKYIIFDAFELALKDVEYVSILLGM